MQRLLTEVETAAHLGYGYIADFRRDLRKGLLPRPTHGTTSRPRWSNTVIERFLAPDDGRVIQEDERRLLDRLA